MDLHSRHAAPCLLGDRDVMPPQQGWASVLRAELTNGLRVRMAGQFDPTRF